MTKIIRPNEAPSRIILPDRQLDKNRLRLAEATGIPNQMWTDEAVTWIMSWSPEPIYWKNRLMIAMTLGELGYSAFWQRLTTLKHLGWHLDQSLVVTNSGQYISDSHNKVAQMVLDRDDWDYLVWLEHDHEFPPNMLEIMSEYTDPIVSGLYFNRDINDPQPVAYKWNSDRTAIRRLLPFEMGEILEEGKRGLYDCDVVPMGCIAIRRDVLEQWPEELPIWHAPSSAHKFSSSMSDDVWFCRQAQDQGWPIKIDSRIIAKHYTMVPFDERFYLSWFNQMRREGKTEQVEEAYIQV